MLRWFYALRFCKGIPTSNLKKYRLLKELRATEINLGANPTVDEDDVSKDWYAVVVADCFNKIDRLLREEVPF